MAASVEMVSGDGQEALLMDALPEPLRVRVLNDAGNPVSGAIVKWQGTIGPIQPAEAATDLEGIAEATWRMGKSPGTFRRGLHQATARVEGLRPPVTFNAHAWVGPSIEDFSFTPMEVDVSTSPATIVVRAHLMSDYGIIVYVGVRFKTPSGVRFGDLSPLTLASGTTKDGVWEGTVTIPEGAEPGAWPLSELDVEGSMRRVIGNASSMDYRGMPSTLTVTRD